MHDSVLVMGIVVDHLSNEPQPHCLLHFVQGSDTAAIVHCDEEGYFLSAPLPVGNYTLCATLKGHQVYRADLVLNDNAALYISIITDTFSFRNLQAINVKERRRQLGTLLISSYNDTRMWNLSGQMVFDDRSASRDLSGGRGGSTFLSHPGLEYHPLGSSMKNDLILYGRILDNKRRSAPADTTAKGE